MGSTGQPAEVLLAFHDEAVPVLLGKLSRGTDDFIDVICKSRGTLSGCRQVPLDRLQPLGNLPYGDWMCDRLIYTG